MAYTLPQQVLATVTCQKPKLFVFILNQMFTFEKNK